MQDSTLERVSQSYRQGYRDGFAGRVQCVIETGLSLIGDDPIGGTLKPFAAFDYESGYRAGRNDANPVQAPATAAQIEASKASRAKVAMWHKQYCKMAICRFCIREGIKPAA